MNSEFIPKHLINDFRRNTFGLFETRICCKSILDNEVLYLLEAYWHLEVLVLCHFLVEQSKQLLFLWICSSTIEVSLVQAKIFLIVNIPNPVDETISQLSCLHVLLLFEVILVYIKVLVSMLKEVLYETFIGQF